MMAIRFTRRLSEKVLRFIPAFHPERPPLTKSIQLEDAGSIRTLTSIPSLFLPF